MIDILAGIAVALAMFGIIGMVLAPVAPTHSCLHRIDRRRTLLQRFGQYFTAPTKRAKTAPWWENPFHGL